MSVANLQEYGPVAIYLAPAVVVAILLRLASKHVYWFALLTLSGTLCHELMHMVLGQITGAKPVSIDLFPRRGQNGEVILGSVSFANLRWYNAAPTCLAPLLGLPLVCWIAWSRVKDGWTFSTTDLLVWSVLAPQLLSFWPSSTDLKLSLRSWPYLVVGSFLIWHYWLQFL